MVEILTTVIDVWYNDDLLNMLNRWKYFLLSINIYCWYYEKNIVLFNLTYAEHPYNQKTNVYRPKYLLGDIVT